MASFTLFGSSTTIRALTNGETGFIGQSGSLATTTDAIIASGSVDIVVFGSLYASSGSVVDHIGTTLDLSIGAGASVVAVKGDSISARFTTSVFISNDGYIGSGSDAIDVRESDGAGSISILNTGTISARSDAIVTDSGTGATSMINYGEIIGQDGGIDHLQGGFSLVNYGHISGKNYGVDGANDIDTITNHGSISGGIKAQSGNDIVINRGTIDFVELSIGDDIFDGRGGDITGSVFGGAGNDTYIVSDSSIELVELLDEGIDLVKANVSFEISEFIENLSLIGSSDINGVGNSAANILSGNSGNNILRGLNGADEIFGNNGDDRVIGGKGADTLRGGAGDDVLRGGSSQDKLFGGDGNDTLIGGAGKDVLNGGAGEDVFVFNSANHSVTATDADKISDFESGVDRIDLSGLNVGLTFIGSTGFSGSGAEVRIISGATSSSVLIDTDGDGSADMKIKLTGVLDVTEIDFIL